MGAALIGGMDRLHKEYKAVARQAGVKLKTFTGKERDIAGRIGANTAFVVLMTDRVSHKARKEVLQAARSNNIPVYQFHSSGVSTLKGCFQGACSIMAA